MPKSIVSIVKGTDADKMVEDALDHLGGVKSLIKKGSTVVVKPNAGHVGGPETGINTSPAVVKAVMKAIQKAHPKKIILAESSAIGCDTMECLEASGIKKAAEEAGVDDIRDIKSDKDLIKKKIENPRSAITNIDLPRFLLEADHIVNVPIFKSHVSMVFTCALKNIKGVVQDMVHAVMHMTNLAAAMMDQWSVVKADLSIADLIRPMEGFGPHSGTTVDFGCIVASKDPVALDATVCRMIDLDIDSVDYFKAAIERGLGNSDEDKIEIRGNSIEEVFKPLYLPYLEGFGAWPEYRFHTERSCSSCQGLLAFTMSKLKSLNEYDKNKGIDIVIGKKKEIPEGVRFGNDLILMGDCTKSLKNKIEKAGETCLHVGGCPPGEPLPCWTIVERVACPTPEMLQDIEENVRKRQEREEVVFKKWLETQRRV
jgi:uncharacterized protein (DUF362 family)